MYIVQNIDIMFYFHSIHVSDVLCRKIKFDGAISKRLKTKLKNVNIKGLEISVLLLYLDCVVTTDSETDLALHINGYSCWIY